MAAVAAAIALGPAGSAEGRPGWTGALPDVEGGGSLADSLAWVLGEELRGSHVGILAVSLERGDTLVALHEGLRFIPGSSAKLFPLGAFLVRRGAAARATTTLEAIGRASWLGKRGGGEVAFRGDLLLRPCGMPDVVPLLHPGAKGLLDSLAERVREGGLARFDGTLWLDPALFADEPPPSRMGP